MNKKAFLIYDITRLMNIIETTTFASAESNQELDDVKKAMLKDIFQDEYKPRSIQIMDLAADELTSKLGGFSKKESMHYEAHDNDADEGCRYVIELNITPGFPSTALKSIELQGQEYIVSKVISEWTAISVPELSSFWSTKASECEDKINRLLTFRMKPLRRKDSPF